VVCEVYWTELGAAVYLVRQYPCVLMCSAFVFLGALPDLISGNIRVHADVAEVSQKYICSASLLRDRPRKLLSATESVAPRGNPGCLLRALLELPFLSSQVPDVVAPISGVCALRSTAGSAAF
jgi:hypothetical protein